MKEVIGRAQKTQPLFPSKIIVNNIEINEDKRIVNEFNNFFIHIDPELAKAVSKTCKIFRKLCTRI